MGLRRENNEDRFHCDAARGLFLVVDGVGGQAAGEQAAEIALRMVRTRLERETGSAADRLREAITLANNEIHREASANPALVGMSCVLTVALVRDGRVIIGHVGDSRLYLFAGGDVRKVTHDHSPVGEREDAGELDELEAMRHPRRNEIYRDVGSTPHEPADEGFVEIVDLPFGPDDAMLLCTDGLSDLVPSAAIASIVYAGGNPQAVVERLIESANAAGGKDNVTVVFVAGTSCASDARRHGARCAGAAASQPGQDGATAPAAGHNRAGRSRGSLLGWLVSRPAMLAFGILLGLVVGFGLLMASAHLADRLAGLVRPESWGRTWKVGALPDDDVTTIDAALRLARPGDTIEVGPGEYTAPVVIEGAVRLVSRKPHEAILRPPGPVSRWTAITVRPGASGRVSGFTIRGEPAGGLSVGLSVGEAVVEIEDVEISGAREAAVSLLPGSRATIRGSHIHDNPGAGVVVEADALPRLLHNVVTRNGTSPAGPRAGLEIKEGGSPHLFGNIIAGNGANEISGLPPVARTEWQRDNVIGLPAPVRPAKPAPVRQVPR
jgi:serine/threonine protein phosphatase PrpC